MTPWPHVPIIEVIRATKELLQEKSNGTYEGGHQYSHGSKSGECLVVWPEQGRWYCNSCKDRGGVVDWLVGTGTIDDTAIESRDDAVEYLTKKYGAPLYEWQEPVPFPDMVGPPAPVGVLPAQLERFIDEQTEALQVPRDLMMTLGLGACSAVASPRAGIRVKLKTPTFNIASKPLEELEREAVEASKTEIAQAEAEHDLLEMQLTNLQKLA